jgi:putative membrane protein
MTEQDRTRVSLAVQTAEQRTSAEIVPMIVSRSGLYRDARHRNGLSLALLVLAGGLTFEAAWLPWGWHAANAAWLLLATLAAYALGAWLGTFAPVIRIMTSAERMRQKVKLRAERAFSQHAISQTRERTGVLVMVSLLERQVYVLPDRDIGNRVTPEEWASVASAAVERLKADDLVGGLCAAIDRCGELAARVCPARSGDNPNEISDRVIEDL